MNEQAIQALANEIPVIERIINAYLTHHPDLAGIVVNGVRFTHVDPPEEQIRVDKIAEWFDGDVDKATAFNDEIHNHFNFKPANNLQTQYKPCRDAGGVFYIPVNEKCP